MSEHTPGPWTQCPFNALRVERAGYGAHEELIATVEAEADARLIAAAPDLLAALEELVTALEAEYPAWAESTQADRAYVAIARAKGGEDA